MARALAVTAPSIGGPGIVCGCFVAPELQHGDSLAVSAGGIACARAPDRRLSSAFVDGTISQWTNGAGPLRHRDCTAGDSLWPVHSTSQSPVYRMARAFKGLQCATRNVAAGCCDHLRPANRRSNILARRG